MKPDGSPSDGFFSTLAHWLRHPVPRWSQARAQVDDPNVLDRQALRQTLERKRRNDLVRRREFAQLRRLLRQQQPADPVYGAQAETSRLSLPEAPAGTLRKIDAIEEQMAGPGWTHRPLGAMPPPAVSLFTPSAAAPAEPMGVSPWAHDIRLEAAALAFACGEVADAETSLRQCLAQAPAGHQLPVWQALFDLYRAVGWEQPFAALAVEFVDRVGQAAPAWFSLPPPDPDANAWRWTAPAVLTPQAARTLREGQQSAPAPWLLVWTALEHITPEAVELLEPMVTQWAQTPGRIIFQDASVLGQCLRALTRSGDRSVPQQVWWLRLAVLRVMQQPDSFEFVALDYCVTYEVSPPSWVAPVCSYVERQADEASGVGFSGLVHAPDDGLAGFISHDATPWLAPLEAQARPGALLRVDCARLIRLDLAAAGSLLNWAARLQAQGCQLRFEGLHQLLAVLLGMIGLQAHAQLVARRD